MIKIFTSFVFILFFLNLKAQSPDCEKFRDGEFVYPGNSGKLSVREGSVQKSFNDGKLEMLWDVRWISECEYELTCKKMFVKTYPIKKGDRIYAKIIETEQDCFTAETLFFNKDFPNGSNKVISVMCFK